jgi:hypothetical protein
MGQSLPKHDVRCMSASPPDSDQISNRERGRLVPILLWKSAISITRCLAGMAPGIADPVEASSLV